MRKGRTFACQIRTSRDHFESWGHWDPISKPAWLLCPGSKLEVEFRFSDWSPFKRFLSALAMSTSVCARFDPNVKNFRLLTTKLLNSWPSLPPILDFSEWQNHKATLRLSALLVFDVAVWCLRPARSKLSTLCIKSVNLNISFSTVTLKTFKCDLLPTNNLWLHSENLCRCRLLLPR